MLQSRAAATVQVRVVVKGGGSGGGASSGGAPSRLGFTWR